MNKHTFCANCYIITLFIYTKENGKKGGQAGKKEKWQTERKKGKEKKERMVDRKGRRRKQKTPKRLKKAPIII